MKMLAIIAVLCSGFLFCRGQDSTVVVSPSMFNKTTDACNLGEMNAWLFKSGSDTAWAARDIDVSGWQRLRPEKLSAEYVDKNGKAEGWFRMKIKLDEALDHKLFGIKVITWGACDVYIDGILAASFGHPGTGTSFREYRPFNKLPVAVNFQPGKEYTLALHVVDHLSPLPPERLRSEDAGVNLSLRLTGPNYSYRFLRIAVKTPAIFDTIWIAVCGMLCLFFWVLSVHNPLEKNFRLIAVYSTFLALTLFCYGVASGYLDASYIVVLIANVAAILFASVTLIMGLVLLVNIFNRVISTALKVFMAFVFAGLNVTSILPNTAGTIVAGSLLLLVFAVCVYYVLLSRKTLKGGQWTIVFGLCFSILLGFSYLVVSIYAPRNISLYYLSLTGYALSFPLSLLVYVSRRFKEIIKEVQQRAREVIQLSEEKKQQALNQQNVLQAEVDKQTSELRRTLSDLKSTQSQLIQSEKMASLGELTAGIAHEIQNPLNFVNNFSEVNRELMDELKSQKSKLKPEEQEQLLTDIDANLEKINFHGKRADAIVKSMLQHSRRSSGKKELTDINLLCDEYLRLAYHGLRAKDKSFNAKFESDFDPSVGKINVVPQDIGRVLLNLINNAFYAVTERLRDEGEGFQPTVSISTKNLGDKIEMCVTDNGKGIPKNIMDKIFQPFFTTKPTGEGTGLGLSLTYDIITQEHNGTITVDSNAGEFSRFTIQLPKT